MKPADQIIIDQLFAPPQGDYHSLRRTNQIQIKTHQDPSDDPPHGLFRKPAIFVQALQKFPTG